jgi:hypothetical protein
MKYDAWKNKEHLSVEEAKRAYVEIVEQMKYQTLNSNPKSTGIAVSTIGDISEEVK